ncbi:MAG TPA: hypothetical protein VKD72_37990, partial [Gemmataceae bacterium]|nr:hypothetical protein [Gemmataceae bacterium]
RRGKKVTLEGLRLPEPVPPASGPVAERVWESADSVWTYFKPWPSEKTRRKLHGWTDSGKFAVCWLTTRLNFFNALVRFDQTWTMFSPNVGKWDHSIRVERVFQDGTREIVRNVAYPEDLTRYDSMRFITEKVLQYQTKLERDDDARLGYCNLIAHRRPANDRGSPLTTIFLYKRKVHYPEPGADAMETLRSQSGPGFWEGVKPFYEYDVKTRNGWKLNDQ